MRKLNAQQIQAIENRAAQLRAATSACQRFAMIRQSEQEITDVVLPCPLEGVSAARWRAMLTHVWRKLTGMP